MEENKIQCSKYVWFDTECGRFFLTSEASEMIYRQKGLICSYSGSNEWIHHFACEMLDFYTGDSIYNYALGTVDYEKRIPEIFKANKDTVINFIKKTTETSWGRKMYAMIDAILDDAEGNQ